MIVDIAMPQMGESVAEGTVLKWHKSPGDPVTKDETILEISTDKVDAEIPAPESGVLTRIDVAEGAKVDVGTVLGIIDTEAAEGTVEAGDEPVGAASAETAPAPAHPPAPAPAAVAPAPAPAAARPAAVALPPRTPAPSDHAGGNGGARPVSIVPTRSTGEVPRRLGGRFFSPLVRSMAAREGLTDQELSCIAGSGLEGRVTGRDVQAYLAARGPSRGGAPVVPAGLTPSPVPSGPDVEVIPMDSMRKAIAEHMVRSVQTSPHVSTLAEADMSRIVAYREAHKEEFLKREGVKLTYTPYFSLAVIRALRAHPFINASVDGETIILKRRINLGVAVAVDDGLVVPVLKDADGYNFLGLARGVHDLVQRARSKKLKPDEVSGGTFTITNMGVFGALIGTPIINQPQVAIMGIGAIQKRPVVVGDAIGIRSMVYLSLSFDHRLVDGMLGARFLGAVVHELESMNPATLL